MLSAQSKQISGFQRLVIDDRVVMEFNNRRHFNKQRVFRISKVMANKTGKVVAINIPLGMFHLFSLSILASPTMKIR